MNFISAFPSPGSFRDFPQIAVPWPSWLELVGLENETIANLAHLSDSATNAIYRMIQMSEEMGGHALKAKIGPQTRSPLRLPRLLERQGKGLKWHGQWHTLLSQSLINLNRHGCPTPRR
jgi:hypothetical protein